MKYPTMRFVFDRKKVATKTHKGLVQIEVLSEGKRKWIGTGVKVYSDQWNDRKKIINSVEMIQLNQCLDEQLRIIQNWINELISKKEVFDFDKLDRFLRYTNKSESFVDFVERRIEGDHPHEMIWVHSSGNMFSKFIYLEKSMVRQYLELAKKKIHSINPDYVLIDTPPSVTNVHIELLSRVKVSYVLFVTQPTKLSNQDVLRTMDFFHERCGKVNCGIVENMCYGTEHNEYPIRLVAQIPMQDNMNTENLLTNAYNEFQKIVDEIVQSDIVVLEEYSTENGKYQSFPSDICDLIT